MSERLCHENEYENEYSVMSTFTFFYLYLATNVLLMYFLLCLPCVLYRSFVLVGMTVFRCRRVRSAYSILFIVSQLNLNLLIFL